MSWSHLAVTFCLLMLSVAVRAEAGVVAFALGQTSVGKGDLIDVGQTITTGVNGHVHIKFVDGALVSVRPNSKLTVEAYSYDPSNPDNNRVKFYLETGSVRSITGEAGRLNKKGFRMNTPISAIGIRGTDYTVTTTDQTTRVFVQSGGVAVAPLDEACTRSGFGVCQSAQLVELFAGDEHILELSSGQTQARLIDLGDSLRSPELSLGDQLSNTFLQDERIADQPSGLNQTDQVAWGHWSNYESVLNQYFLPLAPYIADDWRVISSNQMFGLFVRSGQNQVPRTGSMNLSLDRYQAFSIHGDVIRPASIRDASLSIDFSNARFNTQFSVENSDVSTVINGSGVVDRLGFLRGDVSDHVHVNGSLDPTQSQAGLLFEQNLSDSLKVLGASAWIKD